MSTIVCQGLQSCLESQLTETRTLRLKLALPKPSFFETIEQPRGGGPESSYVHPMFNRSLSLLSNKSLELCTENLGSETGTDTIEIGEFSLSSPDSKSRGEETPTATGEEPNKIIQHMESSRKVMNGNSRNFPPPLTTMTGAISLQVRPHREGGRLVIRAVEDPSPQSCFQAERSHGRLRLSFWKDYGSARFDSEMAAEESEEDSDMKELENEEEGDEEEEGEEESDEDGEEESDGDVREDMDGNNLDVGVEMGMEKYQRPSRCKEGGLGNESACNWVAVSVSMHF